MRESTGWPFSGGEMADAIRSRTWAGTPLGAVEAWPHSLRTAVQTMLENPRPAFVAWGPDLRVLYNDAYRPLLGDRHPEALGAPLSRIGPEREDELRSRVDAVRRGEALVLPERAHAVRSRDGSSCERWFRGDWWPLRDEGGAVRGLVGTETETTERVLLERALGEATDARARSETASREQEVRYRRLFDAIDEGFCVVAFRFDAPGGRADYRVVEANPAFYERTGFPRAILGRWLREAAPQLEEHWYEIYGGVARTGEPVRFEQQSEMLGRWFDVYAFRIDDPRDHRVAILFNDISERKRHEEQTELLLREVNHRSKNLLSVVQAIARQTAASGADAFVDRFGERVQALAAAQDVLIENAWKTVPVADLIRSQLGHFSALVDVRIAISGPPLSLTPDAAQVLGMCVHELATNAAKYGALSDEAGRIAIGWSVVPDASSTHRFELSWLERDGPPVAEPGRRGFGSRVTRQMVEASTGGEVTLEYAPAGLAWRLACPAASVLDDASVRRVAARAPSEAADVEVCEAPLVLLVDDEHPIAEDLAAMLAGAGFSVLGPAGCVDRAIALLERRACDGAVLHVDLGRETLSPVAQALRKTGIPFVLVSDRATEQLPEELRSAPLVPKPVRPEILEATLRRALDDGEGRPRG